MEGEKGVGRKGSLECQMTDREGQPSSVLLSQCDHCSDQTRSRLYSEINIFLETIDMSNADIGT